MILEIKANSRKVNKRLDAGFAKFLGVANTRSLEYERRTECATRDNDLFSGLDDAGSHLARAQWLRRDYFNANRTITFKDDLGLLVSNFTFGPEVYITFSTLLLVRRCKF